MSHNTPKQHHNKNKSRPVVPSVVAEPVMQDKLGALLRSGALKVRLAELGLPALGAEHKDGVDHINIWEYGQTTLGRALAASSPIELTHTYFGPFANMYALQEYIGCAVKDESLRVCTSTQAKKKTTSYRRVT